MAELKPCPFCKGKPKVNARQTKCVGKNWYGNVKLIWTIYIKCNKCHSRGAPIKTEPIWLYEGERGSLGSGNFYNTEFWRGSGSGLMTATLKFEPYVEKAIEAWNRRAAMAQNERRLIDANALSNAVAESQYYNPHPPGRVHINHINEHNHFLRMILDAPTVDAVEVAEMKEFAEDVAYQFGYYCQNKGRLCITHGGLSTLEWAFDILGWENPHPVPECECEFDGCHEHATCGTPTKDGYKRVCGKHFNELQKEA